jgi:hypothetical protein
LLAIVTKADLSVACEVWVEEELNMRVR